MPPDFGHQYDPAWTGTPPHMAPLDVLLWERCRSNFSAETLRWYFDVAVGEGSGIHAALPDPYALAYYRLTRKRIDAVAESADVWNLLELRPNAGLGALGAIQTYRSLWERDPPDHRPAIAWLITDRAEPDTLRTAVNANVRFLVV